MLARAFGAFWEPRNSPLPSGFESDPAFVPFTSVEVFGDDEGREHHHSALGVVMPRKGWMCNGHLFHVLDCMLPAFAWVREYFPDEDPDAIVFVPALYSDRFHGTVARAIFPGARIVTSGRVTIERGVAVEPEEAVAHRPWGVDVGSWNLFEMSMEPVRLWMPEFVDRVLRHSDASHSPRPRAPGEVRAVYLSREDSIREISPSLRAAIVTRLLEVHGVTCHVVAIDGGASLEEQVRLFAEVDLLVGLHGNGLSNLLWVPHHGAVLELFPTEFHHYHYQLLSEMRGLQYVGIQEDNPQPYRRGSRRDDFYGPLPFVPESLDWDVFDREIKYILRRMLHGRLSVQDI